MKKIISTLFISLLVVSVTACNSDSDDAKTQSKAETSTSSSSPEGSGVMGTNTDKKDVANAFASFGRSDDKEESK